MRAVHAYVAKIHVLIVDNDDVAVLQRQHLEGKLHREGGRRRNQPALVIRSRKAFSGNGKLSLLLHHGGRFGGQDRIAIIADKLAVIGLAVRKSAQIAQWLRTRWHPLKVERVLAPSNLHEAGRTVSGKCRQGEHHCREGAQTQSVAFHLMSPSVALSQKSSPWGNLVSAGSYRGPSSSSIYDGVHDDGSVYSGERELHSSREWSEACIRRDFA